MKKTLLIALLAAFTPFYTHADEETTTTTTVETEEAKPKVSRGGLFIEPILSVSREDSTIKTGQLPIVTDDTSGTMEGFGVGLRAGVHVFEALAVGADARYSRMRFNDSFYESADGDMYNIGPSLVLQTPVFGIRVFGTYIMAGQFNPGSGVQGLDTKFTDAGGYRLGAGLHFAALSLNVEYQDLTFDNTDIESFGSLGVSGASNVDFSSQGYALSLSFPVEL
jgi:hypothetical protein